MGRDRIRVGRLPSRGWEERSWRLMCGGSAVGLLLMAAWTWVVEPEDRVGVLLLLAVLLGPVWAVVSFDSWLDLPRGRLRQTCSVLHWEVVLAEATTVRLQHNTAGLVGLQVTSRGRWRSVRVPIAGDDVRGLRAQPPPVLRMLAREVRRWAPPEHHAVADELDAQADHLEGGGDIRGSPVLLRYLGRA